MNKPTLFLFLLFIPIAFAIPAGTEHNLTTVDTCRNNISVHVTGTESIDDSEYWLNCEKISDTMWTCPCGNPFTIVLNTKTNTINEYDFILNYEVPVTSADDSGSDDSGGYYYIRRNGTNETIVDEDGNVVDRDDVPSDATIVDEDDQKRKVEVNDVAVTPEEPKKGLSLPSLGGNWWIIFVGIFLVVFGVLGAAAYWLYKKSMSEEDTIDGSGTTEKEGGEVDDEDVDEYLRKLS